MKITGKELQKWNVPAGPVYPVLMKKIDELDLHRKQVQKIVKALVKSPKHYLSDENWGDAARLLMPPEDKVIRLMDNACPTKIYGEHMIEGGAVNQIYIASKLPVSIQAALMPDGHSGYGLPIGGVLATDNVVIPFAVGLDIACRMHISITDIPASKMEGMRGKLKNTLVSNTFFGTGCEHDGKNDHAVLSDDRFNIPAISKLKDKAARQIGTSGGGNHFVEYGVAKLDGIDGEFLAILSHSGSRGFGAEAAKFYTDYAISKCKLQLDAKRLAYLSLDDEGGQEYWDVMNLAGDYAKANHQIIHDRIIKDLGVSLQIAYENHHNFAWKKEIDGKTVIVHRKGATPAEEGVIGIIPSSLSTPAYIVEGLGNPESIYSSSHGTGRTMSRKAAKETFTMSEMKKDLLSKGIELIGGSVDECKDCYKDVESVMNEQSDLVKIKGSFMPWMVRMAGAE